MPSCLLAPVRNSEVNSNNDLNDETAYSETAADIPISSNINTESMELEDGTEVSISLSKSTNKSIPYTCWASK